MSEFIQLSGLDEIKRRFAAQPALIATKVLRKGVLAGANLVKKAAIAETPFVTGTLRRAAIVKFVSENSNATQVEYIVTFRKGKRQRSKGRDSYYASWVEFGHKSRNGGLVPPHRFLKPAFDLNYHQALAIELSTMRDSLAQLPDFQ
jgi:HK97 gp10 family phage protein